MFRIDWNRYYELMKKPFDEMTEEENEFCKYMYHVEEHMAGLDGDREERY